MLKIFILSLLLSLLYLSNSLFFIKTVNAETYYIAGDLKLNDTDSIDITFPTGKALENILLFSRENHTLERTDIFSYKFSLVTYRDDSIPENYLNVPYPPNKEFNELESIALYQLKSEKLRESFYSVNFTFYSVLLDGYLIFEDWNSIDGVYTNDNSYFSFEIPITTIVNNSNSDKEFIFSLMGYKREIHTTLNQNITINSPGNFFIQLDNILTLQYKVNKMYLGDPIIFRMDKQNVLPLIPPTNYIVLHAIGFVHFSGSIPYILNNWILLRNTSSQEQNNFTDYAGRIVDIDINSISFANEFNGQYKIVNDPTYWISGEKETNLAIIAKLKNPPLPSKSDINVVYLLDGEDYSLTAKQNKWYYFETLVSDLYDVHFILNQPLQQNVAKITIYLKLNSIPTSVDYDAKFETVDSNGLDKIKVNVGSGQVFVAIVSSYQDQVPLTVQFTKPLKGVPFWIIGPVVGGIVFLSSIIGITILVVVLRKKRPYQLV
ncbi:hypothetical protein ABK040_003003 [Willaertia magna]